MTLGQKVIDVIENRRDKQRKRQLGPEGEFWRNGGNNLLYDLPVTTGSLVIDAGGYQGEWTAGMIARYGCKSHIYEPVPAFYEHCKDFFKNNSLVQVHEAALGASDRKTIFNLLDNGTSEHRVSDSAPHFEAEVIDVSRIFREQSTHIACFKLNIEGGEYEVLERLIETDVVARCESFLIQFHRQPNDYNERYGRIFSELNKTHKLSWCYEMVWEKWISNIIN
jgi:FkbM family methyltransferase